MSRLTLPTAAALPAELKKELTNLDMRLRLVSVVKGLGGLLFVSLLLAALFLITDFFFPLPGLVRLLFLVMLCSCLLSLGYRWLFLPLVRKRRWPELAYLIDRSFPELQERVCSTVELALIPEESRALASSFMQQRLRQETDKRLAKVDLWECLSLSSMAAALFAGLITAVVASVPFLWNAGGYSLLWQRLLTPWENLDSAANLTFIVEEGDRVLPRGDDLHIQARPEWRYREGTLPREIRLSWTDERGESNSREMSYDSRIGVYVGKIPQVTIPLTYYLSSPGARSRTYAVQVADRPRIVDARLTSIPPAYTKQPAAEHPGAMGTIRVIEGSELVTELQFEHPVTEANWLWNSLHDQIGSQSSAANPVTESTQVDSGLSPRMNGILAADGLSARISVMANQSDTFQFEVVSAVGLKNINEPERMIVTQPDRAPRITLSGSQEPLKVRSDEIVSIELQADDDFGVVEMQIVVEHLTGGKNMPVLHTWSSGKTAADARLVQDAWDLDLSQFELKPGDIVGYRAVARDARPVPGPNEVWTSRRVLLIDGEVKSLSGLEVEDFYEAMRRKTDIIKSELVQHRREIEQHRSELDPKPRDEARADLQKNQSEWQKQKLALSLQLEELSRNLQQRPITAALSAMNADPARELIEQTAKDLAEFHPKTEIDPLELIRADESKLKEAENLLNRLLNQLRDAERIEQELTELEQLSRRARSLAEEAAGLNETESQAEPAAQQQAEKNQQPETAENQPAEMPDQPETSALDQLEQEYSALTQDLQNLINRRPELKQAAKNALLSELEEAATAAAQMANDQQELTASLEQQRQNQTENEAQQQRQQLLEEALELAEKLAERSEKMSAEDGAQVFNADPTAQAIEEQQQGNQGKSNAALEEAKAALERFEQDHQQKKELPADVRAAAQQLAEESRELAQSLEQHHQAVKEQEKIQQQSENEARKQKLPIPADEQAQLQKKADELDREQQQLSEQLAGLMQAAAELPVPPQRHYDQMNAVDQMERAADELAKKSDQADNRLNDAARTLDNLAKAISEPQKRAEQVQPQLESVQQQAKSLADQFQQQAEKAANGEQVDENLLKNLAQAAQNQARQLMQQDVLTAEPELADAVEQALQAKQQAEMNQPEAAAEAQQKFAEQIEKLKQAVQAAADKLQQTEGDQPSGFQKQDQKSAWKDLPLTDDLEQARFPKQPDRSSEKDQEQLEKLLQAQQQLNEKSEQVRAELAAPEKAQELKNRLNQLAGEQQQIAQQVEQLRSPEASLPRAQALESMMEAVEEMRAGESRESAQKQQQAARQLQQAAEQMENQLAAGQDHQPSAEPKAQQLAEQLAEKLAQLQQEKPLADRAELAAQPDSATENPETTDTDNPTETAAADEQTPTGNAELVQQLQRMREQQQRLAEQANQLAQQGETNEPEKTARNQALQAAAEKADEAASKMLSGQLQAAAEMAGQAEQNLQQAEAAPSQNELAQQATEAIAKQQGELAEQLQKLAQNPAAAQAARQTQQQALSEQTAELATALKQLSEESASKPLDERRQGEQLHKMSQQAERSQAAMQQALVNNEQQNLQQAADYSEQAASQLQELSQQAQQLSQERRDTLVPEPVGAEAAEASRMLNQAQNSLQQAQQQKQQQQMAQQNQQANPQTPASPAESTANNSGTPQPQQSGEASQPVPSPLQQLAEQLAGVAQSLQEAHENLQPPQQNSQASAEPSESASSSSPPSSDPNSTSGNQASLSADGPMDGEILKSALMRNWGQKNGALEADLTDARRRDIQQEYGPLTKRYLESLSRTQAEEQQP